MYQEVRMSEDVQLKAFQERLMGLGQEIDRLGNMILL